MKIGVHVSSYTWPRGPQRLAQGLTRIAQAAEHNGFDKLSVMDHLWQITHNGPPENEMLEAYTTLGYLAARTGRIQLLALVTAAIYREPGLLAKAVTTLDVLSEGRAWLGIGAASAEQEARGLGLTFPPAGQRFGDSKRRCRSACRCGAATTARTPASTTGWRARSTRRSR
jgi:alkanesulfonate monooxygenase SsuD/methylene tetrahydromethanopterin reductase-like flavin-dependent oxidoreductase (luciferase family)